jgi:hypothetical protein
MKTTKTPRISKKQKLLLGIAGIFVVLAGWWGYVNFMPHPLGDRLEYLGKENLGGGLFFRDYAPYSVYYYGTDMSVEEVVRYFKGARLAHPLEQGMGYTEIWLKNDSHSKAAKIFYYETAELTQANIKNSSGKRHVIKTHEENYELLRQSL